MNVIQQNSIKKAFESKNSAGFLLVFIFSIIYLIGTWADHGWLLLALIPIGLILFLFLVNKARQLMLWCLLLSIMFLDLVMNYFLKANHHFLLVYIILLIILYLTNGSEEHFILNIKWIVVIVLAFAAIQKLLSPQFISGDFYYYMFNTGKFFKPFLNFSSEMSATIAYNNEQVQALKLTNPNTSTSVIFQNIHPNLDVISRAFAWISVAFELAIAICFIWKPKHIATHLLFIFLIVGIFVTRLETGFLILLAICGLWLTNNRKLKTIYMIFAIGFMVLIIANIGLY